MTGHYVSAEDIMLLDAALAPFTETEEGYDTSGLRLCATAGGHDERQNGTRNAA
jgi:hypothetical protein